MSKTSINLKSILTIGIWVMLAAVYPIKTQADENLVELVGARNIGNFLATLSSETKQGQIVLTNLAILAVQNKDQIWIIETTRNNTESAIVTPSGQFISNIMRFDSGGARIQPIDSSFFLNYTPTNLGEPNLEGICTILSAIDSVHRVLKLGNPEEAIDKNGDFKREFLVDVKNTQTDPSAWGTPTSDEEAMYSKIAGQDIKCDFVEFGLTNNLIPDINPWQEKIKERLSKGQDCRITFVSILGWAHTMNIKSTYDYSLTENEANFTVIDTGRDQGDGKGNGVSATFEEQYWSVKIDPYDPNTTPRRLKMDNFKGENKRLWNHIARQFRQSYARCCYPVIP